MSSGSRRRSAQLLVFPPCGVRAAGAEVDVVEVLADIAGNAEGLAIDAARGRALVLFDGKDADGDWSPERPHLCVEHARQDVIVLPAAPLRTSARRDD